MLKKNLFIFLILDLLFFATTLLRKSFFVCCKHIITKDFVKKNRVFAVSY